MDMEAEELSIDPIDIAKILSGVALLRPTDVEPAHTVAGAIAKARAALAEISQLLDQADNSASGVVTEGAAADAQELCGECADLQDKIRAHFPPKS